MRLALPVGGIMKNIAIIAFVGALSTSTAFAADLGIVQQPAPAAYTSGAFDWSGFYAGANLGYGWTELEDNGLTLDGIDGILGGVQVGYNYDFGGFVLGLEGDIQLSDMNFTQDLGGATGGIGVDYFGTLRARAGVAVDRFMPYVTGGVAWARGAYSISAPGISVELEDNFVGWTVGGGVEYAVTDNVTVKGEYLYADFGEADFGTGDDVNFTSHIVRAGVNFKF
jgi:outer membrane immunogenic protein